MGRVHKAAMLRLRAMAIGSGGLWQAASYTRLSATNNHSPHSYLDVEAITVHNPFILHVAHTDIEMSMRALLSDDVARWTRDNLHTKRGSLHCLQTKRIDTMI